MTDFYFYACVIALIMLIILLAMIGIAISKSKSVLVFPPTSKNCPDYWTEGDGTNGNAVAGYCLYPNQSTYRNRGSDDFTGGSGQNKKEIPSDNDYGNLISLGIMAYRSNSGTVYTNSELSSNKSDIAKYYIKMTENDASWNTIYNNAYTGLTTRCAKRKWAIDNGIVWDGITNYTGCK